MKTIRSKVITVGVIFGVDILAIIVFGFILNWI